MPLNINVPSSCTQELNWGLSPQTAISWLNVYMQVAYLKETEELLIPIYPQATFTQIAKVCVCVCVFEQSPTVAEVQVQESM